jgi:hypothetical protein
MNSSEEQRRKRRKKKGKKAVDSYQNSIFPKYAKASAACQVKPIATGPHYPDDKQPEQIGSVWRCHSKTDMRELEPIGPFKTSIEYFLAGLNNAWSLPKPLLLQHPLNQTDYPRKRHLSFDMMISISRISSYPTTAT